MKKIVILFYCILFLNYPVQADDSLTQIKQKLDKIERDISDLQRVVFSNNDLQISNNNQNTGSEITVFDMRLRDIESELQSINLNYENISFEIEDLKETVKELTLELSNAIITINTKMIESTNTNIENNILDSNNNIENNILDSNESQDLEDNTLGTLKISSNDLSETDDNSDQDEVEIIFKSPEEQFQAAFDNLRTQKFEKAKSDLELFIKNHVSHNLSGSAHYWLGEIYFLQKEYREAALVFAEGYQKYPNSVKSPDSLYKLAETLIKIEKKEEACNTLKQFVLKYSNNKLIDKTESKIKELQCI